MWRMSSTSSSFVMSYQTLEIGSWQILRKWFLADLEEMVLGRSWGSGSWQILRKWFLADLEEVVLGRSWGSGPWQILRKWFLTDLEEVVLGRSWGSSSISQHWKKNPAELQLLKKIWLWSSFVIKIKIVKMKYNRIDIKWWLVSTSFKIYLEILSNFTSRSRFCYNTISLKGKTNSVLVKGLYQTE